MSEQWQYQIRVYLTEAGAEAARRDSDAAVLRPLTERLGKHRAVPVSQLDAFEAYVAEAEGEGAERFPLYRWTKATLEDPEKRRKYMTTFTLRVEGQEVYGKEIADALEVDLRPLVGDGLVTRMSRHDTNPANNPQMPAEYRS